MIAPALAQAQAVTGVIPQCKAAWNSLGSAGQLKNSEVLVKTDCAIMHKEGWLEGPGVANPAICAPAWNALVAAKVAANARELVTRNCPVLYKQGWLK